MNQLFFLNFLFSFIKGIVIFQFLIQSFDCFVSKTNRVCRSFMQLATGLSEMEKQILNPPGFILSLKMCQEKLNAFGGREIYRGETRLKRGK